MEFYLHSPDTSYVPPCATRCKPPSCVCISVHFPFCRGGRWLATSVLVIRAFPAAAPSSLTSCSTSAFLRWWGEEEGQGFGAYPTLKCYVWQCSVWPDFALLFTNCFPVCYESTLSLVQTPLALRALGCGGWELKVPWKVTGKGWTGCATGESNATISV